MSESEKEIKNSIEGLKNAYQEFMDLNKLSETEKKNANNGSYVQLKERIINASAVKVNYNSTITKLAMSQHLSMEMNSLKREIINQTKASQKSASQQRLLTGAIIFIGMVSIFVALL